MESPENPIQHDQRALIHQCVQDVLRDIQCESPLTNITVLKILPHDLLPVPIDPGFLQKILFQLIRFAQERIFKSEKAGLISIEAAEKICLSPENKSQRRFILRVSDSGPEIPQDQLASIFDPLAAFPEMHDAKKMLDRHAGTIRVETSARSTAFHIELPA